MVQDLYFYFFASNYYYIKKCVLTVASALDPEILEAFNNASTLKAGCTDKDGDTNEDEDGEDELEDDFIRMAGGPLGGNFTRSSHEPRIGGGNDEDDEDTWGEESDDIVARPSAAPDRKPVSALAAASGIDDQLDQLLERDYADDDEMTEDGDDDENSGQHTLDPSDPQLVDTLVDDLGKFFAKKCASLFARAEFRFQTPLENTRTIFLFLLHTLFFRTTGCHRTWRPLESNA